MSSEPAQRERGSVITFYSFKGGVGRSMALANVAVLLARWGKRVLILDWDLEAPGIEKFFEKRLQGSRRETAGLVDLICDFDAGKPRDWHQCLLSVRLPQATYPLHIVSAGRDAQKDGPESYSAKLQSINWSQLFEQKRFGAYLELLRQEWSAEYDFVLIDSRTGITDIGGICTIHLPDILVCLFTTTEQSLKGVRDVMERAQERHAALPVDREALRLVPLPARDESRTEYKLAKQWRETFARELGEFLSDWVPESVPVESVFDLLKLPYVAYWSFGEKLPVLDEDVDNPDKLAYFYQQVGRLLLSRLDLEQVKSGSAAMEASAAARAEAARQAEEAERTRQRAQEEKARRAKEKEAEALATRQRQYEFFLISRWRPALRRLLWQIVLSSTAGSLLVAFGGWGFIQPSRVADILLSTIGTTTILSGVSLWLGLAACAFTWLLFRRRERLLGERALFDGQAGRYERADLLDLPLFIQRTEELLRGTQTAPPVAPTGGRVSEAPPISSAKQAPKRLSPQETPSGGYDVFISYRRGGPIGEWLEEDFLPLLRSGLTDALGRDAEVFVDLAEVSTGDPLVPQREEALTGARSMVALLTPAYFQSVACRREWLLFQHARPGRIIPLLVGGSFDKLPPEARELQIADFREFTLLGLRKDESYVAFQRELRHVVEQTALVIERPLVPTVISEARVIESPPEILRLARSARTRDDIDPN